MTRSRFRDKRSQGDVTVVDVEKRESGLTKLQAYVHTKSTQSRVASRRELTNREEVDEEEEKDDDDEETGVGAAE